MVRSRLLVFSLVLAFATGASAFCIDDSECPGSPPCGAGACVNALCRILPVNEGTVCRASSGPCDPEERCNGTAVCPPDAKSPSGTSCREAAGPCDLREVCNGTSAACPPDVKVAAGVTCRSSMGSCDPAETCDGSHVTCPADTLLPATTPCRPSAGPCDVAEFCPGNGPNCPADGFQPSGTLCRAASGDCDVPESCTGSQAACPADRVEPAGIVCRAAANDCDLADACDGSSKVCSADSTVPGGSACENASACVSGGTCAGAVCIGGQPELTFAPDLADFPSGTRDMDVAIRHTGSGGPITLTSAGIDPPGTFLIVTAPQWPLSLPSGSQARLAVRIAADAAPGEHTATLKVQAANCADQPVQLHATVAASAPDAGTAPPTSSGGNSNATGSGGCSSAGVPAAALALVALTILAVRSRRSRTR